MNLYQRFNTAVCVAVFLAIIAYCAAEQTAAMGLVAIPATFAGWYSMRATGRQSRRKGKEQGGGGGGGALMLPKGMVNLLVLLAVVHAGAQATIFRTQSTLLVSDLTQFLVHIQLIKLFDRRTHRDDAQLLGLSVFIVIGAMLTSNALLLGLILIAYTPIAVLAAMLLQIAAGQPRRAVLAGDQTKPSPARAERKRRARAVRHLRRVAVSSVVLACAMAAVVFVLTPRNLGQRFFGRFGVVGSGASPIGFSDGIALGRTSGRLTESEEVVMEVVLKDASGAPLEDPAGLRGPLHLRGSTLGVYRGGGVWDRGYNGRNSAGYDVPAGALTQVAPLEDDFSPLSPNAIRQEITILNAASSGRGGMYLFGAWRPVAIQVDRDLRLRVSRADSSVRCFEPRRGPWRGERSDGERGQEAQEGSAEENADAPPQIQPLAGRLTYLVVSVPDAPGTPISEAEGPLPEWFGRGRFGGDREPEPGVDFSTTPIGGLAREVVSGALRGRELDPENPAGVRLATRAILDEVRSRCVYSLDLLPTPRGKDPIEAFLFENRQGHCEYFAAAMTAMCQSVGIHARIATGYLVSEFDEPSRRYIVRERDAHAWVEVELPSGRWATFDPTPPDALEQLHKADEGVMATIRGWYEALELQWARSIVGFDASTQAGLWKSLAGEDDESDEAGADDGSGGMGWLGRAGATLSAAREWFEGLLPAGFKDRWREGGAAWVSLMLAGVAMFTAGVLWLLRIRRDKGGRASRRVRRLDPELKRLLAGPGGTRMHTRLVRALRRAGLAKPPHRSLAAHAESLDAADPRLAADVARLAQWYERLRFGRVPLTAAEAAQASGLMSTIEERLAKKTNETRAGASV